MKITEFECGGFVMGLRFNHACLDGLGIAQFICAVSELARGLPQPTVKPIWERDAFPNPNFEPAPLIQLSKIAFECVKVDFPLDYINKLKGQFMEYAGKHCSTFDVITSKTWQCCVKAIDLDPDLKIRMLFCANTRDILKINKGYYGNSNFPAHVDATSGQIAGSSVVEIVDLIKKAKERLAAEVLSWANEEMTHLPAHMDDTLLVTDLTKLGFYDANYGWGPPMYYSPLVNHAFPRSSMLLRSPAPLQGTRLIATCVSMEHRDAFPELINHFD